MIGTSIVIIAIVIDVAFATYCIVTRSNQNRVRSFVRIGALATFVSFTLLSVIEWGIRWYTLAVLLLIWAALGAWTLIGKQAEKKAYTATHSVVNALVTLLLVVIALTPALIFPQHALIATTGTYQVATVNYTYTDPSRSETFATTGESRKLNVELWYPQNAAGTYPLIVFSHGATGIKSSNQSLFRELASHGYVVSSIDHPYHSLYTTAADGQTTWIDSGYLQELQAEDAHAHKQQSYADYQKWMKLRTDDINFVLDYTLAAAKKGDAATVYNRIDPTKVGVMGHSLGGSAALGIGRMRDDVSAVIALESPFLTDIEGVKDGAFVWNDTPYPVPVLNVYGEAWSHLGEWTQYAENNALLSATPATAFNVYISGIGHLTLTDLALTSPLLTRILNGHASTTSAEYALKTVNKVCLAFFDSYLKGQGSFTAAGTY